MSITRLLLAYIAASLLTFAISAQSEPFTGAWVHESKDPNAFRILNITIDGYHLVMKEDFTSRGIPFTNVHHLYTDKRGEKNMVNIPGADRPLEVVSRTYFDKKKLVRETRYRIVSGPYQQTLTVDRDVREQLSVSADGKTLTVETRGYVNSEVSRPPLPPGARMELPAAGPAVFVDKRKYVKRS
jgi:hypothetical protein